jgi:putative hydrolase of the HAD superfamily
MSKLQAGSSLSVWIIMRHPVNHIKAVFFDLDGTLRHSVPTGGDVFNQYVASLGHSFREEDRLSAVRWEHYYWASSPDLRDDLLAHSADTENFWIEYSRRRLLALGVSAESAAEIAPEVSVHMGEMYKPDSVVPEDVRRMLPALREAGYRLAVISNRDRPFRHVLDAHGLSEFFLYSLAGGEVDSYKPEPGIFEHALRQVQVTAPETVYVGDNYYADIVGARRAGLQPVLYDPDRIFPDADCATIHSFDELIGVIRSM